MRICVVCNTELNDTDKFCPECGNKMPVMESVSVSVRKQFCPKCGAEVNEGDKFCPECGAKMAVQAAVNQYTERPAEYQPGMPYQIVQPVIQPIVKPVINTRVLPEQTSPSSGQVDFSRIVEPVVNVKPVWRNAAGGHIRYCNETHEVIINKKTYSIDDINGANLNVLYNNKYEQEIHEGRRRGSRIGALAGGIVGGALGAAFGSNPASVVHDSIAGAGIGSAVGPGKRTKGKVVTSESSTCLHVGVLLDVKGFELEKVFLDKEVPIKSKEYINATKLANEMIDVLREMKLNSN